MQEEVENRTLTLVVNGTKFTARLFKLLFLSILHTVRRKNSKTVEILLLHQGASNL